MNSTGGKVNEMRSTDGLERSGGGGKSNSNRRFDERMRLITFEYEVFVLVFEDVGRTTVDLKRRRRKRIPRQLRIGLLQMIEIDVAIAAGPNEFAHIQVALLREQVRQQRIRCDVEWHAQEDIGAALVQLARQLA